MVCCFINDDEVPTSGHSEDVISTRSGSVFVLNQLTHFHAYQVTLMHNELLVMQQEELAAYHPLEIHKSFSVSLTSYVYLH